MRFVGEIPDESGSKKVSQGHRQLKTETPSSNLLQLNVYNHAQYELETGRLGSEAQYLSLVSYAIQPGHGKEYRVAGPTMHHARTIESSDHSALNN